jgi:OOP family OmpA-OmpF porin
MDTRSTRFHAPLARALPALLCSMLIAGSACADGAYVLGSFGQSRFSDDIGKSGKDEILADAIGFGPNSSSQDDRDNGYKVQLGYRFNENFALEGGYADLGQQDYKARYTGADAKLETSVEGWNIDGLLILPVSSGVSFLAKIGAIDAKVEQKVSVSGGGLSDSETVKETKVKPKFGLGLGYQFHDSVAARLEWERYYKLGDEDETGEIDVDFYSLGLSFHF